MPQTQTQTDTLTMAAIGSAGVAGFQPGIHLRWAFDPNERPRFPQQGFRVYRRAHEDPPATVIPFAVPALPHPREFTLGGQSTPGGLSFSSTKDVVIAGHPVLGTAMVLLPGTRLTITSPTALRSAALTASQAGGTMSFEALDGGTPVSAVSSSVANAAVTLTVRADRFDTMVFETATTTGLAQIATIAALAGSTTGWVEIAGPIFPSTTWSDAAARLPPGLPAADVTRYQDAFGDLTGLLAAVPAGPYTSADGDTSMVIRPLATLLALAIDPNIARMLGLYFVDKTAVSGAFYDYKVTGSWLLGDMSFVCYGRQRDQAPAVGAPPSLSATVSARRAGLVAGAPAAAQMCVDLAWPLPGNGSAGYPVRYRVLRARKQANGTWGAEQDRTGAAPITPLSTQGKYVDGPVAAGELRYRVQGIDLFGRSGTAVGPTNVTVVDTVPPPPPINVRASLIRQSDGTVALEASWEWPASLREQAPDAATFQVLYRTTQLHANGVDWGDVTAYSGPIAAVPVTAASAYSTGTIAGFPLSTTLASPVKHAFVVVATVDAAGNVGRASVRARVHLRREQAPAAPSLAVPAGRQYATRADFLGRSRYTLSWTGGSGAVSYDVYRASDAALFALAAAESPSFSEGDHLTDAAFRALAEQASSEGAFVRVNAQSVSGTGALSFTDTFDGRANRRPVVIPSTGETDHVEPRVAYRLRAVDGAGNRSALSSSAVAVRIRDVTPPRAPVLSAVVPGDRAIALEWQKGREKDIARYRVYRAATEAEAADLRSMTRIANLQASGAADLETPQPGRHRYTDQGVSGLTDYYYRLTATDRDGNESAPSRVVRARAYDTTA